MLNKKLIWRASARMENDEFSISELIAEIEKEIKVDFDDDSFILYQPDDIVQAVSTVSKIDRTLMLARSRRRDIVQARQIAMYLLYKYTKYSYQKVGYYFDRDHATAIHSENKVKDALNGFNPILKEQVEQTEKVLKINGKYEIERKECIIPGCEMKSHLKGLCKYHYNKSR